jgi:YfiH family protein
MSIPTSSLSGAEPRFELSPSGHFEGADAAVTERGGGVSHPPFASLNVGRSTPDSPASVRVNEDRILDALRLRDSVARLRLEHGARVLPVNRPGLQGPADALFTAREDLILWLTVADCYPVFLAAGRVRALGHCGWRGTAAGLVETLIETLAAVTGIPSTEHRAWIGPGIGPCCFEVGPEVAAQFPASAVRRTQDALRLDLRADIVRRCGESGLPSSAVLASPACTSCRSDRFYSHRRDGVPSGRMAALFWNPASLLPV